LKGGKAMSTEIMQAAPAKYLTALAAKDLEGILALYADDAVVEDPVGSEPHVGMAAIREFYKGTTEYDLEAALDGQVRLAGNEVAFPFIVKNIAGGFAMHIIDVFKFNDEGKIVSMRAFWGETNAAAL
jgi:steroid delta-isomerase